MKSEDVSEREDDARRGIERKRLDEKGLPKPSHERDADALAAGAGEALDHQAPGIPAEDITDPNPTQIGER